MKFSFSLFSFIFLNLAVKLCASSENQAEESLTVTTTNLRDVIEYESYSIAEEISGIENKKKRDVTVSIITAYSTLANGNTITIYGATTMTVDGTTSSTASSTSATSVSSTLANKAVETSSTASASSSSSNTAIGTTSTTTGTSSTSTTSGTATESTTTGATSNTAGSSSSTTAVGTTETAAVVNAATTTGYFLGSAGSSSSSSSSSSSTNSRTTGTGYNPSTSITPLPSSAVTTLSIKSYDTVTLAYTTYTTKRAKTSMWVTLAVGQYTEVIETTFAQRFKTLYSSSFEGSSGSIGLGTYTGSIGVVKSSLVITNPSNKAGIMNSKGYLTGLIASLLMYLI
ncbi:hypothetical protein QEN19_004003 [Hanseniaspora menglaensis]